MHQQTISSAQGNQPMTALAFGVLGLLALGFHLAFPMVTNAQESRAKRTRETQEREERGAVPSRTYPLSKDDPKAQMETNILDAEPASAPAYAQPGLADDNKNASRITIYDPVTRAEALFAEQETQDRFRSRLQRRERSLLPGNIGPDDNIALPEINSADIAQAQPETVFGPDDRRRVTNTTAFPWRTIVKLYITFPDGYRLQATGAMVSRHIVLTAGHCTFRREHGGFAATAEVLPGLNNTYKPYGTQEGVLFGASDGWRNSGDSNYDLGIVVLKAPIGDATGYMALAVSDTCLQGITGYVTGYPTSLNDGRSMYYDDGRISCSSGLRVCYTLDTSRGMDGGPLYFRYQGQRVIYGVNTVQGSRNNCGVRISREAFNQIQEAIAQGY